MKAVFNLTGQLKTIAGAASFECRLPDNCELLAALNIFAKERGGAFMKVLLTENNRIIPSVLIFSGDKQIYSDESHFVKEGEQFMLMLPIAGGCR